MKKRFALETEEGDFPFYHKIPLSLYKQLVQLMNDKGYNTRTSAVNDLIRIGITVVNNISKIEDPELVSEITNQLHEGGLVDYVARLNPSQLEVIWSIVRNEVDTRGVKGIK